MKIIKCVGEKRAYLSKLFAIRQKVVRALNNDDPESYNDWLGKMKKELEGLIAIEQPASVSPPGVRCEGCGCEISDNDSPNVMIGKNPGQYCSQCTAAGSIIRRGEGDWIYEPIVKEAV